MLAIRAETKAVYKTLPILSASLRLAKDWVKSFYYRLQASYGKLGCTSFNEKKRLISKFVTCVLPYEETTFCDLLQKFDDGLIQRVYLIGKRLSAFNEIKGLFHSIGQIDDFFVCLEPPRHNPQKRPTQNKDEMLTT